MMRAAPDRAAAPLPADAARDRLVGTRRRSSSRRRSTSSQAVPRARPRRRRPERELRRRPALRPAGRRSRPARATGPARVSVAIEAASAGELERTCPFCAGREAPTPPETLALPRRTRPTPAGGRASCRTSIRRFERQEVVVHGPEHGARFAELDDDELALVAEAWQCRGARPSRAACTHALVNEGRAAGRELPHSHSQLVWLDEPAGRPASSPTARRGAVRETASRVSPSATASSLRAAARAARRTSCWSRRARPRRRACSRATRCGRRSRLLARDRPPAARASRGACRGTRGCTTARTGTSSSCRG